MVLYKKQKMEGVKMTDNEKRAHDLAIAISVPKCIKKEEYLQSNKMNGDVDYFSEYINVYEIALRKFNEKFPNQ